MTQEGSEAVPYRDTEPYGYIKAGNKEKIQNRLRRIEGQVRGIKRMVDQEAYCIDIVTQITSVLSLAVYLRIVVPMYQQPKGGW